MKHRPPNPGRTTMRMRLVDGTPTPFGEVEFRALDRPRYNHQSMMYADVPASQLRIGKRNDDWTCRTCGFVKCTCEAERGVAPVAEKPVDVNYGLGCPEPTVKPAEQPPEQRRVQVGDVFVWKTSKQHYTVRAVIADQIYWQGFSDLVCTPLCLIDTVATRIIPTPEPITPAPQPQSGRLENCTIELAVSMMRQGRVISIGEDRRRAAGNRVQYLAEDGGWSELHYSIDDFQKFWGNKQPTGWTVEALP